MIWEDTQSQFAHHFCPPGEKEYGEVSRNLGGEAPHAWTLWLDAESTDITYCPFCGERLPMTDLEWMTAMATQEKA